MSRRRTRASDAPARPEPAPDAAAEPLAPAEPDAPPGADAADALRDFVLAGRGPPFDAAFFLSQLRAFVRDGCPGPEDLLPRVEVHLVDGAVLDLCHVIGVAPAWVALAVNDERAEDGTGRMRTDLVPYRAIARVTLRPPGGARPTLGFSVSHAPKLIRAPARPGLEAEAALVAAADPPGPARRG